MFSPIWFNGLRKTTPRTASTPEATKAPPKTKTKRRRAA